MIPGIDRLRRRSKNKNSFTNQQAFDAVNKYGSNGVCFLTLYGGFESFEKTIDGELGTMPYVDTPTAMVAGAEPLAPKAIQSRLILEFCAEAKRRGKSAVILPLSKELALEARKAGLYVLQIGDEPWIPLEDDGRSRDEWLEQVTRRLKARGATVEAFDPLNITERVRSDLDAIVEKWLESRASVPLAFLNRVEPWLLVNHKKYFRVVHHNRTLAFLAAAPVPGRKAWYLADLLRTPGSPPGTTELLVMEAMKQLKKDGAVEVTLGLSPLVKVDEQERTAHPRTYQAFDSIFENSEYLYGFKTLFEYKDKFSKARWEPAYLVASPKMGPSALYGLFLAVFPKGMIRTLMLLVLRKLSRIRVSALYPKVLSHRLVPRAAPETLGESIVRLKAVLTIAAANILFFMIITDTSGQRIRPRMEARYGYSLQRLLESGVSSEDIRTLILPSFLHWDLLHIGFNLGFLVLLGGFLEIVAGSTIAGSAFILGMLLANPLTSAVLYTTLWAFDPGILGPFVHAIDVGCSLGVFACIGVLTHFLHRTMLVFGLACGAVIAFAVLTRDLLALNHITALAIGLAWGRYRVPKSRQIWERSPRELLTEAAVAETRPAEASAN